MSGSLDLQSVKTQQLILQNPDGSFPAVGGVLAVIDDRGSVGPVSNLSVERVSVDNVNITGAILQDNITAIDIQTNNVNANTVVVDELLKVTDISTNTVNTVYVSSTDLSGATAQTSTVTADYTFVQQLGVQNTLSASTIKTPTVSSQYITSDTALITDLSAGTINTERSATTVLNAGLIRSNNAEFVDLSSNTARITTVKTTDICANTVKMNTVSIGGTLNTKNLNVQGTFTFNELDLTTLTSNTVVATDISTGVFLANSAKFDDISAQAYSITNLNVKGRYNVNSLRPNYCNVTTLNTTTAATDTLNVTGTLSGTTTINTPVLYSTNVTATNINTAGTITAPFIDVSSNINLNNGILSYSPPSSLLVNGTATTDTSLLYQQQYYNATINNSLATVVDISNTMNNLTVSFNNFMNIFSTRGLVVSLTQNIIFNSSLTIRFTSATKTINAGNYTLANIISTLNTASAPLVFSTVIIPQTGRQVTVRWVGTGSTPSGIISDVSSTPTSSLQLLRLLGFAIDDANNPFQTYIIDNSGGTYYSNVIPFRSSQTSTNYIDVLTNYPNRIPAPTYILTATDPYTASFSLTNSYTSNAKYFYILNTLYPVISNTQIISNLFPNTTYVTRSVYLDNYNRSPLSLPVTITTPNIQPPQDLSSSAVSFNSITLTWNTPNAGRSYTYKIDASGAFIPSITTTTNRTYTFSYLLQNSPYDFKVYTTDLSNNISAAATISVKTSVLSVTAPSILTNSPKSVTRPPNNTSASITWANIDASGTLYYSTGGPNLSYTIPTGTTSFGLSNLVGTGDISCSLMYTDNSRNTVFSTFTRGVYDASFGFFDLSATLVDLSATPVIPFVLNGTNTIGLGHSFMAYSISPQSGPWIGYRFNRITFPQNISASAPVTLIARVYDITPGVYRGLYDPSGQVVPFNISQFGVLSSSSTAIALTTGINFPTLTFTSAVTITNTTHVLFQITSGSGTITFKSFKNAGINANTNLYATSLWYTPSGLYNQFIASNYGVICQFTIV